MFNNDLLMDNLYGLTPHTKGKNEIQMPSAFMPAKELNKNESTNHHMMNDLKKEMKSMNTNVMMDGKGMGIDVNNTDTFMKNNLNTGMGNENGSLYNPKESYEKGNLFSGIYDPYKDYKPVSLKPKDEKERLFLELAEASFAAHELNLYLDVHPEDNTMITLFNDYRERENKLTTEYERKYGPLNITSEALDSTPWMWTAKDFPWEGGML